MSTPESHHWNCKKMEAIFREFTLSGNINFSIFKCMMMKNLLQLKGLACLTGLLLLPFIAYNQLDVACFNAPHGWVTTNIKPGNLDNRAYAVATQWDQQHQQHKIVVAGYTAPGPEAAADFAVVRYNEDGSPDASFGDSGIVTLDWAGRDDKAFGITIDGLNRIVVGGHTLLDPADPSTHRFAVARLLYDGSPDPGFGGIASPWYPGKVATGQGRGQAITVDAQNRIIITGHVNSAITGREIFGTERLKENGDPDPAFGGSGRVLGDIPGANATFDYAQSVIMADPPPTQRIVVSGYTMGQQADVVAVRYLPNGVPDEIFGAGGLVKLTNSYNEYAYGIDLQTDGKYVLAGYHDDGELGTENFQVLRIQQYGWLDLTFNAGSVTPGWRFDDFSGYVDQALSVKVCPGSGRIALGGWMVTGTGSPVTPPQFALACLDAAGALVPGFGAGGKFSFDMTGGQGARGHAIAIEPTSSQKIVVAGYAKTGEAPVRVDFAVLRLHSCCAAAPASCDGQACDVKTSGCIQYEVVSVNEDAQHHKTYDIRVTNNCSNGLIYAAIGLPKGLVADWPVNNDLYTSPDGRSYLVRNPNFTPFYSVRFSSAGNGIRNGESDVFQFTLPAQANLQYIHVTAKLESQTWHEAYLNVYNCPVGQGMPTRPAGRTAGAPAGVFGLFPNPTDGTLFVDLTDWEGQMIQMEIFDVQGKLIQNVPAVAGGQIRSLILNPHLPNGLFLITLTTEAGDLWTERFVLKR